MNILMLSLINTEQNDAGKVHFLELAYSFSKIGNQVSCVLPRGAIDERFTKNCRIHQLPFKSSDNYFFLLFLNILLFIRALSLVNKNTDFVYIRFRLLPCNFLKILLILTGKKTFIFTEHPGWVEREMMIENHSRIKANIGKFLQKSDSQSADFTLAMTEGIMEKHIENGLPANKISVLQNGTNTDHYFPLNREIVLSFLKNQFSLPENAVIFGFSGNISKWQGINDLINASIQLMDEFPVYLLIIGTGKYLDEIKRKISQLNVNHRIFLKENVPYADMNIWNNCIDIAFAPKVKSLDGFTSPLKLRDYAACGKPVISTAIRGIKEFEPYGWLITYELNSSENLEMKMRELLQNPERIKQMGLKAREFAENYFSWDKVAQKTIDIYANYENKI